MAAHNVVRLLTGQDETPETPKDHAPSEAELRSQAASILGKLGGRKGGLKRAKNLTAKQRSEIAAQGAKARWKGHKKD